MKKQIFIILLLLLQIPAFAQEQTPLLAKKIYILDLTKSMIGEGKLDGKKNNTKNILDTTLIGLSAALLDQRVTCDDDEIVIIPFTNKTFDKITGMGYQRDSLSNIVRKLQTKPGDTNIDAAWQAGIAEMDSTKINCMFLITDGIHNAGPDSTVLYDHIGQWEENEKDIAVYWMLTDYAQSWKIESIASTKNNMITVKGPFVVIDILQFHKSYYANVFAQESWSLQTIKAPCWSREEELPGVEMQLKNTNNYMISDVQVYPDRINFLIKSLKEKKDLPIEEENTIIFKCENPGVKIAPKEIEFQIINQGTRTMKIY